MDAEGEFLADFLALEEGDFVFVFYGADYVLDVFEEPFGEVFDVGESVGLILDAESLSGA